MKPVFLISLSGLLLIRRDTCPGIIGAGEAGDGDDDGLRVGADLDRDDFDFDDSLQESE